MTVWLLADDTLKLLNEARAAQLLPSAEEQDTWAAEQLEHKPREFMGATAEIHVKGVLTKEPDFFAALFGGGNTAYSAIIEQLALAEASANVADVLMVIDSPGGHVDGLFETLAALEAFPKPIKAVAGNAQSAAYAIAAASGPITATSAAAKFGSIGIVQDMFLDENIVTLTNTQSPDKRPDVTTKEGRAVVVRKLDAMHELLVESIASNRDADKKTVNTDFGRGATLLAGEAKQLGMIDGIARPVLRAVQQTNVTVPSGAEGKAKMTLEELQAQHPSLYKTVFELGAEHGTAEERERCCGHLLIGEKSNAMPVALKAIKEGTGMSFGIQAEYMAAMAARGDNDARGADDDDVAKALAKKKAAAEANEGDLGSQVADKVEELLGIGSQANA